MQDPLSVREPQGVTAELRTFMFADIRGYTRFSLERGDEAAMQLVAKFAALARESVTARGGQVIELHGDEILAVFGSARQALRAAVELQVLCAKSSLEDPTLPLPVGVGLDAGEAIPLEEGFKGRALNLASRLCGLAGAGEVLATQEVAHLAGKMDGLSYAIRGTAQLKGFASPTRVVEVWPEEKADAPTRADLGPSGAQELRLPIGGFLGALPEGIIVGRDPEIARILGAVDAVAGGSGRLLMLGGEPGVGKTRIAQEITLRVRNLGFLVAAGRCYESHRAVPFYPFLEALATAYEGAPSSIKQDIPRRWPYLERLLSNETESPLIISSDSQDEQQRLFRAVTGFIQAAASEVPVAILLDDLHWADASSLELLQQLARHTRSYRVLLLGTYRDVEVTHRHPLERALRDLNREHLVDLLKVDRLEEQATAALAAAALGEAEVAPKISSLLHSHTEGNPFFIHEIVRALVERGDLYQENGHWAGRDAEEIVVPDSVRSAIIERLSRLVEATQQLLYDASVLGQQFTFELLQALTQDSEPAVEKALEEALASGLIRETGTDTYAFGHALGQQALYTELSGRRRRRLHLAAAEALERLPDGARETKAAELAWHFLKGEDPERAFNYAVLAGDQAKAIFAHAEAEIHYRTALRLAKQLTELHGRLLPAAQEAQALEKLGGLLRTVARYDQAHDALLQASSIYESTSDLESEVRVTAQIGLINHARGTVDEGMSRVLSLIGRLESLDPPRRTSAVAKAYIALAHLLFLSGKYEESMTASEGAAEIAREIGDAPLLVEAQALRGDSLGSMGRRSEALHVLEEIIPVAEACGDLEALFLALDIIAETYMIGGEFRKSRSCRERALQAVEKLGDQAKIGFEASQLGHLIFCLGDWEAARYWCQRGLDVTASLASSWVPALSVLRMATLHLGVGDWEQAARCVEEGLAVGEQSDNRMLLIVGHELMAELELSEKLPEKALNRLRPLVEDADPADSQVLSLLALLALAHLGVGDDTHAEEILLRALELSRQDKNQPVLTDVLRVHGKLLAKQGLWRQAEAAFDESLSLARAMPFPLAEARTLYEYGLMKQIAGKLEEARTHLSEAAAVTQSLGARKDMERIQNALHSL